MSAEEISKVDVIEPLKRQSDDMEKSLAKRPCPAEKEANAGPEENDKEESDGATEKRHSEINTGQVNNNDYTGEVMEGAKYEYLDHTADIQIHCWGDTLEEAFEQAVVAMNGYQTELEKIDMTSTQTVEAEGEDALSLLFHFLDEFLFIFAADPFFVAREVKILEFDRENWRIVAEGRGEAFDLEKHPQGTEVKAITYSNMQIHEKDGRHDCYFILDI
ncbi:protein archease-like [Sycon ciliatum]|uniref:protein archease-like n=1 Tax=Sycon ciliatum TaxID=27933 RepID=UPI0031F644ED